MKNIHLLPTDKPSRLWLSTRKENYLIFDKFPRGGVEYVEPKNIYITSEKDIKDNDWIITKDGRLVQVSYLLSKELDNASKIILTTDQDLIKDGIQEIDDEFLEWFVKNPSCDNVEVEKYFHEVGDTYDYEIIIPKEEYIFPDIKCKCIMFEPNSFTGMCKNCGFPPKEEPKTIFESLQEYLKNTPKEKILEDWNEFQHLDNEGITVKEFLENQKQIDEKEK